MTGALGAGGLLTASACTPGIPAGRTGEAITLLTYDNVDEAKALRAQLADIRSATGIASTLDTVPGSGASQFPDKLRTRILGGQAPDVWRIWGGQIAQPFVDAGLVLDLSPYYAEHGWEQTLTAPGIAGMTFDGTPRGVPLNVASIGAWANTRILQEAGVGAPNSYAELEQLNERVLEMGIHPGGFAGKYGWHLMRLFEYLLEVTAGPELHDALLRAEADWNQGAVREAFDLLRTWNDRGWITPGALGIDPGDAEQSFVQGTSAYTFSGPWLETQYIKTSGKPESEFTTFLLPTDHEQVRHSGFIEGYMISSSTGGADRAAELLDRLVAPEVQKALHNTQSATADAAPDAAEFPLSARWAEIRRSSPIYTIQDQAFPKAQSDSYFSVQSQVMQGGLDARAAAREMQSVISDWRNSR